MMLEIPSAAPPVKESTQSAAEQEPPSSLDPPTNQIESLPLPSATSSPQQESLCQPDGSAGGSDPELESGPMLYLSESLQESAAAEKPVTDSQLATVTPPPEETTAAAESVSEVQQHCPNEEAEPAAPLPVKTRKLSRLKELGMDPPPVAKLCPDDGAFVQLEPPQLNPGESGFGAPLTSFSITLMLANPPQTGVAALKERYLRHLHPPARPPGERTLQLNIVRKNSAPSGQEELRAETLTVTIKEGAEEPAPTKPGEKEQQVWAELQRYSGVNRLVSAGEKLLSLKQRLQLAMAQRRKEERARRAELHRLDNEDCEEEEEEEEDMTDESEEEEVRNFGPRKLLLPFYPETSFSFLQIVKPSKSFS